MAWTRSNSSRRRDAALQASARLILMVTLLDPIHAIAAPRASAMEPAAGTLPDGRSMLIDDGTCPRGEIKQVVGGNTRIGKPRVRSCVARR